MRNLPQRLVLLGALGAAATIASCTESRVDEGAPIPAIPISGGGLTGSAAPDGSTAVINRSRGDAGVTEVQIVFVTPMEAAVLKVSASPEVRVRVSSVRPDSGEPSGDAIDPESVKYFVRSARAAEPVATGALAGPMARGQFSTRLDLSRVPTGEYTLTVVAATQGGARSAASLAIKVDGGPIISILTPRHGGAYKGSVEVQVVVDAGPFAPIAGLQALVGTTEVQLAPAGAPNTYGTLLEFGRFMPPLADEQVFRVLARNSEGTPAEAIIRFLVDEDGPVFVATEPKEGAIVGGVIKIGAKLKDPAGVLPHSVIAVIGNKTTVAFKLDLKPDTEPGSFFTLFDTARLTSCRPPPDRSLCIVFPNLSFRASDNLGNEATVAYDISVDNHPPVLDLDPPPDMRLIKWDKMLRRDVCSFKFDPLGDYRGIGDMPNDGCAVAQVFDLRARIEDHGNRAEGLKWAPISGVDPATTGVYVLDDTSQPLVVDVDGDGACDAINPKLVPTTMPPTRSDEVLLVRLAPVPPKGEGDFTPDMSLDRPEERFDYPGCSAGREKEAPDPLCARIPIPVAIGYPTAKSSQAAVWGIEPITKAEPWCIGSQFDTHANEIADGWACLAAAASDRIGNGSVSQPLRVWIQRRGLQQTGPACPVPPASAGPPPNCTGSYDKTSGTLRPTPCFGRRFVAKEIRPEGTGS